MLLVVKPAKLRAVGLRKSFRPKFNMHVFTGFGISGRVVQVHSGEEVHRFLQAHLLHWLEALGWMGRISEEIQSIMALEAHVPVIYLSISYESN